MARNPMKLPGLPGLKKLPKEYTDANLNGQLPLKISSSLPSDRLTSPATLAAPKAPAMIPNPNAAESQLSPRAARFRRLAGILGPKK